MKFRAMMHEGEPDRTFFSEIRLALILSCPTVPASGRSGGFQNRSGETKTASGRPSVRLFPSCKASFFKDHSVSPQARSIAAQDSIVSAVPHCS
jgi:hypothetical protein